MPAMVVLIVANFMDLMDTTVVNVALPSIQRDLRASAAQLEWVVGAYTLGLAGMLITGGRLGDIIGRRRTFLIGVIGFTLASGLAAVAGDGDVLVAARAVQGLFAGAMVPQVLSSVQALYEPRERAPIFALVGFITGCASVVGPVLAGWLITSDAFGIGWRSVFAINLPIGVLLTIAAAFVVPNTRSEHPLRLDVRGAALAIAAVLCLVFPLIEGRQAGWPVWSWVMLASAPVLFAGFAFWQRALAVRGGSPLIPLRLFRDRGFVAGSIVNLCFQAGLVAFFLFFTLYLQQAIGYAALPSGLTWLAFSLGTLTGSAVAVPLVARLGRALMTLGAVIVAASVAWIALVAVDPTAVASPDGWTFVVPLALGGLGMGLLIVPLFDATLETVPVGDAGSASGALSTIQQIGGALGIAAIGALFYGAAGPSPDASTIAAGLHIAAVGCVVAFCCAAVASAFLRRPGARRPTSPALISTTGEVLG